MTWFQILSLVLLGSLLVRDGLGFSRIAGGPLVRAARCAVWTAAAVAIAAPWMVQDVAEAVGIGLGANLVLYLFVLAFLWVSFSLYAAHLRVQRQLTTMVRHVALREASFGGPSS